MAKHTLLFHGPFDLNFASFPMQPETYVERGSRQRVPVAGPTPKVTGLIFRYMSHTRRPEQDFVVGVKDVYLPAPVLLVHERHVDGKAFAANSPIYLGDESAMRLIVDMIIANPAYRDTLGRLLRSLE